MTLKLMTYRGDGDDLADLIVSSWKRVLGSTSWFPVWDRDFIRWKVMDPRVFDRDLVVSAYFEERLVGCVVSIPCDFRVGEATVRGSATSFLSADPGYKKPGLAIRMVEEMRRRHQKLGLRLSLGVRNVAHGSVAEKFWTGYIRRHPEEGQILGRFRSWVHVFDGPAVARASVRRREAVESRIGGWLPLGWTGRWGRGEPCRPDEISRDLEIASARPPGVMIQQIYDEASLSHALHHPYCFGFRHPSASALVAGYLIDWNGQSDVRVGFIDIVAGQAGQADIAELIIHAARQVRDRGAQMVVIMDQGAAPAAAFWRAGFVPVDPQVEYFAVFKDSYLTLPSGARCAVSFT